MTDIIENKSLKELNSFGLEVFAKKYANPSTIEELTEICNLHQNLDILILGEGSNILFSGNYQGLILHPEILGKEIIEEDSEEVKIRAYCGENWDGFVEYCVNHGWGGLENLSLIPGSVGSSPVQNIGAYGVEVKDRILWVEGFMMGETLIRKIPNAQCHFDYRDSIFKNEWKGKFIITAVVFRLDKKPVINANYGQLSEVFQSKKTQDIRAMRESVIEIRNSKLPDPKKFGNVGSFFKNPVISAHEFQLLKEKFPNIPSFPSKEGIKIPAAWLIEQSGWKGKRIKDCGTWPNQALVIVNYGNSTGNEILELSKKIQNSVFEKFQIKINREVNLI
ncbi:MAG: UDP-N-acetylmuramate dehydrogenase [Bacteroidales bacterium]|nr:UDP-N-acetylmuramate dehydrogenase [Bacteroidales bacterium]MCF8391360.1 UDP-N-acetylmuramate dehydrogenase [Bacteroidales bacterium]